MPTISVNRLALVMLCGAAIALGLWQQMDLNSVVRPATPSPAFPPFICGLYYGALAMGLLFNVTRLELSGDVFFLAFLVFLLPTLGHLVTLVAESNTSGVASQLEVAESLIVISLSATGFFWDHVLQLDKRAPNAARLIKTIGVAIAAAFFVGSFHRMDGLQPGIHLGAFLMAVVAIFYAFSRKDPETEVQWKIQVAVASIFLGLLILLIADLFPVQNKGWAEGALLFALFLQMMLLHSALERGAAAQPEGRTAEEIRTAERHAELKNVLLERHARWISVIAHEFKTPLSIIDTTASSIETLAGETNELIQKRCHKIQRSVTRLNSLLTSYLAEERLVSGVSKLNPQLVDVETFMERIMRGVLLPPEPKIELKLNLANAPQQIYADRLLLQLTLNNLLANAVKFSPQGGTISVCVRRKARNKEAGVEFEVSDEGIGIREDLLPRLFDTYISGDDRLHEGDHVTVNTGIGLWAVRESVNKHRGNIQVESQPEGGTRFTIWLPVTSVQELA